MIRIRNKKGRELLLPETLKIILAVICLVLLIYLSIKMGSLFVQKSRTEQAKAELDNIYSKIESLQNGESTSYLLQSPKGWVLIGWPVLTSSGNSIPSSCSSNGWTNCLCFCPYNPKDSLLIPISREVKDTLDKTKLEILKVCQSEGVCINSPRASLQVVGKSEQNVFINIDSAKTLDLYVGKNQISIIEKVQK